MTLAGSSSLYSSFSSSVPAPYAALAYTSSIASVDVSRLGDFKGHLTDREMAQVDVALMASLDLHPIPRQAKVRPVGPDVDDAALALIALRFLEGFLQKRCGVTVQDRLSIDLLGQKQR